MSERRRSKAVRNQAALHPTSGDTRAIGQVRRVQLAGQPVDYELIRARRQSIGMEVHLEGLTVRAPRWVTIREIETALSERAEWIVTTLVEWRARRRNVMPRKWKSGEQILYRGRDLALDLQPGGSAAIVADLFHLTIAHPAPHDEREVAASVGHWLKQEAWQLVAARVAHYARRITRVKPTVRLSNAKSEWGSCNAKGEIRLNWRLVQLPPALAEYVVAHEVAHLVELNHSTRFWSLVESLLPGHAVLKRELDNWTALLV